MLKKNEKGFALILALVLLMVMSLMGGSLVVISSSDHRGNNSSDEYQQAFYVAETALLEGEKELLNMYLGKWEKNDDDQDVRGEKGRPPENLADANNKTACYKSFRNITDHKDEELKVVLHYTGKKFINIVQPVIDQIKNSSDYGDADDIEREKKILQKYTYEYFMESLGASDYKEVGSSIAKTAVDAVNLGTAYKVYACGIFDVDKVVIPLESVVVLPG